MPNTREKLIELLKGAGVSDFSFNAALADYLIANGVTIPTPCKDCIYATAEDGELYCDGPIGIFGTVGFNDFCSYGERRDK